MKSKISGYIVRSAVCAAFLPFAFVAFSSAFNSANRWHKSAVGTTAVYDRTAKTQAQTGALTFADRVAYQRAIEEVYWRHRTWPKTNTEPKPPLDKVMSQAAIEKKVEDYLRTSQALEDYWQGPITPDQLQAEIERMASHTKQPFVLREIFAALGNDPFVIAECLARPALAERSITELYGHYQTFHGDFRRRAEAELRTDGRVSQMKRTSGMYTEIGWIKSDAAEAGPVAPPAQPTRLPSQKLAAIAWLKQPLRSWLAKAEAQVPVTMTAMTANYTLPAIATPSSTCADETWTATSLTNVPSARDSHTAVWTGSEMIVWGGFNNGSYLNTGGRYNPSTDSWTATSLTNAPTGRDSHTAVWTGSEMIVWGGGTNSVFSNTGGRYNPSTDTWTATSTTNAPIGRFNHTAVWTGSQMIVWGGYRGGFLNTGSRYNPSTDTWTATSTASAPEGRYLHTAVWTDSEMVVWGGYRGGAFLNTGGRYNPSTDTWTATSTASAPAGRIFHTAVWTGSEMIVWGGLTNGSYLNTGGRYDPSTDSWTGTSLTNAPAGREFHTAVWINNEMIVWGGYNDSYLNTGGRYNPSIDSWTATNATSAPAGRELHTAVWTGSQMIVWGGSNNGSYLNTGGRYCAAAPGGTPPPTRSVTPRPRPTPAPRPIP